MSEPTVLSTFDNPDLANKDVARPDVSLARTDMRPAQSVLRNVDAKDKTLRVHAPRHDLLDKFGAFNPTDPSELVAVPWNLSEPKDRAALENLIKERVHN